MKKIIFSVVALLATATTSSVQAQDVRFGLRAGANYSNLAGDVKNRSCVECVERCIFGHGFSTRYLPRLPAVGSRLSAW